MQNPEAESDARRRRRRRFGRVVGRPAVRLDSPTAAASPDLPGQAGRCVGVCPHPCGETAAPGSPHLVHGVWIAHGTSRSERSFRPPRRPPDLRTYVLSCLHTAHFSRLHRPLSTPLRARAVTDSLGPNGLVLHRRLVCAVSGAAQCTRLMCHARETTPLAATAHGSARASHPFHPRTSKPRSTCSER